MLVMYTNLWETSAQVKSRNKEEVKRWKTVGGKRRLTKDKTVYLWLKQIRIKIKSTFCSAYGVKLRCFTLFFVFLWIAAYPVHVDTLRVTSKSILEGFSKHNAMSTRTWKWRGHSHIWKYDAIFTSSSTSRCVCGVVVSAARRIKELGH